MVVNEMNTTRDQIIQATCDLLENQGYHATGLNEIVKESGAPKGSIYYYFPGGKEDIAAESVLFAGRAVSERIRTHLAENDDPAEAVQILLETIADYIEISGFRSGGPLTIVASETATSSVKLNLICREAYDLMLQAFEEKFLSAGFSLERAANLAWVVTSSSEGGIILSRTYHSGDPLRRVALAMANLIRSSLK